jgi:Nickel responsive protein SCO4226-like
MSDGEAPSTYLVECYWPAVTEQQHAAAAGRARAAAGELRPRGRGLEFLGSILIPAEETVFCLFAGCEEDVRAASQRAGLPFERVLESIPSNLVPPLATTRLNPAGATSAQSLINEREGDPGA